MYYKTYALDSKQMMKEKHLDRAYARDTKTSFRKSRISEEESFSKKNRDMLYTINRLEAYLFIDSNKNKFGLRCLLQRMKIYPNAYYNYLKVKRPNIKKERRKYNLVTK